MRRTQPSKIEGNKVAELRLSYANGAVIQKVLAFLELQKFLGNICSFEQLYYRKRKSLGAPVQK